MMNSHGCGIHKGLQHRTHAQLNNPRGIGAANIQHSIHSPAHSQEQNPSPKIHYKRVPRGHHRHMAALAARKTCWWQSKSESLMIFFFREQILSNTPFACLQISLFDKMSTKLYWFTAFRDKMFLSRL
jgi:hypothetical protein